LVDARGCRFPAAGGLCGSAERLDCGEVGSSVRPKRTPLSTANSARASREA
jgi:hypothetical protein